MEPTNNIPKYLIDIINSPELFAALDRIEQKIGLHIDQTGELYVIIANIILRKSQSSNFSRDVMEKLGVTADVAAKILAETNREVFDVMKSRMQAQTSAANTATVSNIEQAGGFKIEKEPETKLERNEVTMADKEKILDGVENPMPRSNVVPPNLPVAPLTKRPQPEEVHTEPLVDYLLNKPTGQPQQKVQVASTPAKEAPKPTQPRSTPDPYREIPQ